MEWSEVEGIGGEERRGDESGGEGRGGEGRGGEGREGEGGEGRGWLDGTSGMIFISECCDYCLTFSSLLRAIRLVQLHC